MVSATLLPIGNSINHCCSHIKVINLIVYREKNRRFAEQGAALVGLISLGLEPKEKAVKNGTLLGSADE